MLASAQHAVRFINLERAFFGSAVALAGDSISPISKACRAVTPLKFASAPRRGALARAPYACAPCATPTRAPFYAQADRIGIPRRLAAQHGVRLPPPAMWRTMSLSISWIRWASRLDCCAIAMGSAPSRGVAMLNVGGDCPKAARAHSAEETPRCRA